MATVYAPANPVVSRIGRGVAHNGVFGSRPFSRVNQALEAQGAQPIDWRIPA